MSSDHDDHTGDGAALAELLDLDLEVLQSYWSGVLTAVRRAADAMHRERVLDLGAGTGSGTIGLAQLFAGAQVIAVDTSEEMLARIRAKALDLGLAPRVRTVHTDLDGAWPDVGPVDVTWASMSLHHLADPGRVLGQVLAATRPGGLVAVAEFSEQLRFLPDDLGFGRSGLEARCLDALSAEHARTLPHLGADWSARLAAAGFADVSERAFVIDEPAVHPSAPRYARLWLERLRTRLGDQLDPADRENLDVLLDGDGAGSLRRRGDLRIRGARTLTLARRP